MVFQSYEFLIFFAGLFLVYWLVNRWLQNLLLLGASYIFYGFVHPWLVVLLFSYTVVNYLAGLAIERLPRHRKASLIVSIGSSLVVLGFFKYFGFFADNVNALLTGAGAPTFTHSLNIFLPIGISFYTFQTLGYTIDVYRGRIRSRANFIDFALFVSFFPQLVAGPIERASRLLPQFENARRLTATSAREGLVLIIWGFFKKLVIADNVAKIANNVFITEEPGFALLWVGVFAFSIQIFADFSAYTDIARGTARVLGINLVPNFNNPYLARSPSDFWRRWHMSLSFWFRDYVYIPLGGSRSGPVRNALVLLFTFLLTGLWHGASWNFVIWGLYHGFLIQGHRTYRTFVPESLGARKATVVLSVVLMFALTNIGWLIFRESDLTYLIKYATQSPFDVTGEDARVAGYLFFTALVYSIPLWLHPVYQWASGSLPRPSPAVRYYLPTFRVASAAGLFIAVLLLHANRTVDFIYFQF